MLGFLSGKIINKNPETQQCILLTQGVGYEIKLNARYFETLPLNSETDLWIQTIVREDSFSLYGFPSETEKNFFKLLLTASGLGPKMALALLSEHGAERLVQLILAKNFTEIATAPGVGKKSAERIVLELLPKIEKQSWLDNLRQKSTGGIHAQPPAHRAFREDIASALVNLGYQNTHVKQTLDRLFETEELEKIGFEGSLRIALKELSVRAS